MTAKVIHLDKPMTKEQLIRHLESDHTDAIRVRPLGRWKKVDLEDAHRLIHLGLGR